MVETNSAVEFDDVACPFCGLCCDDLRIRVEGPRLEVMKNGCSLSQACYQESSLANWEVVATARVNNRPATLELAVDRATAILRQSRLPIIAGLATDVSGAQAAMDLADRCGAVVDHFNSAGLFRNLHVLQDSGWMTATLTEIRNRADVVIRGRDEVVGREVDPEVDVG